MFRNFRANLVFLAILIVQYFIFIGGCGSDSEIEPIEVEEEEISSCGKVEYLRFNNGNAVYTTDEPVVFASKKGATGVPITPKVSLVDGKYQIVLTAGEYKFNNPKFTGPISIGHYDLVFKNEQHINGFPENNLGKTTFFDVGYFDTSRYTYNNIGSSDTEAEFFPNDKTATIVLEDNTDPNDFVLTSFRIKSLREGTFHIGPFHEALMSWSGSTNRTNFVVKSTMQISWDLDDIVSGAREPVVGSVPEDDSKKIYINQTPIRENGRYNEPETFARFTEMLGRVNSLLEELTKASNLSDAYLYFSTGEPQDLEKMIDILTQFQSVLGTYIIDHSFENYITVLIVGYKVASYHNLDFLQCSSTLRKKEVAFFNENFHFIEGMIHYFIKNNIDPPTLPDDPTPPPSDGNLETVTKETTEEEELREGTVVEDSEYPKACAYGVYTNLFPEGGNIVYTPDEPVVFGTNDQGIGAKVYITDDNEYRIVFNATKYRHTTGNKLEGPVSIGQRDISYMDPDFAFPYPVTQEGLGSTTENFSFDDGAESLFRDLYDLDSDKIVYLNGTIEWVIDKNIIDATKLLTSFTINDVENWLFDNNTNNIIRPDDYSYNTYSSTWNLDDIESGARPNILDSSSDGGRQKRAPMPIDVEVLEEIVRVAKIFRTLLENYYMDNEAYQFRFDDEDEDDTVPKGLENLDNLIDYLEEYISTGFGSASNATVRNNSQFQRAIGYVGTVSVRFSILEAMCYSVLGIARMEVIQEYVKYFEYMLEYLMRERTDPPSAPSSTIAFGGEIILLNSPDDPDADSTDPSPGQQNPNRRQNPPSRPVSGNVAPPPSPADNPSGNNGNNLNGNDDDDDSHLGAAGGIPPHDETK